MTMRDKDYWRLGKTFCFGEGGGEGGGNGGTSDAAAAAQAAADAEDAAAGAAGAAAAAEAAGGASGANFGFGGGNTSSNDDTAIGDVSNAGFGSSLGTGLGSGLSGPAPSLGDTYQGGNLAGGFQGGSSAEAAPNAGMSLSEQYAQYGAGRVAAEALTANPEYNSGGQLMGVAANGYSNSTAPAFALPTVQDVVGKATGLGKATGGLLSTGIGMAVPAIGAYNAVANGVNAVGRAIGENSNAGRASDLGFEGNLGQTNTAGAAGAGLDNGGNEGADSASLQGGGLLGTAGGGATSTTQPGTSQATAAPGDVDYNLFGKLGMGGWSSAARKMAAKKVQALP